MAYNIRMAWKKYDYKLKLVIFVLLNDKEAHTKQINILITTKCHLAACARMGKIYSAVIL